MDAQTLNNQLRNLYTEHWDVLTQHIPKRNKYSFPHIVDANPSYALAPVKLFIVGQQTDDWGSEFGKWGDQKIDAPVEKLMALYHNFNRGETYKRVTPFFEAAYQLQELLNPKWDRYGFMWSNLVRVDYKGNMKPNDGRVPLQVEEQICAVPLLNGEIKIAKPDVVVFFTGPDYEARLAATFEGMNVEPVSGFDVRFLARLQHPDLPRNTFRTYHPGFLRRQKESQKQTGTILNKIAHLAHTV